MSSLANKMYDKAVDKVLNARLAFYITTKHDDPPRVYIW